MGNYPVWWETTITVYNKYEDTQTDLIKWYRHTIANCFFKLSGTKVTINDTVIDTNTTICRIPQNDSFKERYEWEALPADIKEGYFTLGQGDIIVKGAVDDEIDEYTKGKRSTDFLTKYKRLQGCIEVEQVSINTGKGRCNPHYYVTGV